MRLSDMMFHVETKKLTVHFVDGKSKHWQHILGVRNVAVFGLMMEAQSANVQNKDI